MPRFLRRWDGGPVKIEGTVKEGDEIAGFKVVHLPGHAPGLIGLWRESDRLALVSDTLYTLDPADRQARARRACRTPPSTRTPSRRARASASWPRWSRRRSGPGHADPVTGDVRGQLEQGGRRT